MRRPVRRAGWALTTLALSAVGASSAYIGGAALASREGDDPPAPPANSPPPVLASATPGAKPSQLPAQLSGEALQAAVRATVRLTPSGGGYSGSGTLVSADGLVLTNAHVAAPQAPGLALMQGEPQLEDPPDPAHLVVWVNPTGDGAAKPTYRASVVAVDGYLDLAVLRIDALVDGSPLPVGLRLPTVPRGSMDDLDKNDRLTALGFPGLTGGERLDVTDGTIRNLLPDEQERVPAQRYTVATTVAVSSGNSGGAALDNAGRLVAVPSAVLFSDVASTGLMRPVDLAEPLLQAAAAGRPYISPWFVASTGREQAEDLGWTDEAGDSCDRAGTDALSLQAQQMSSAVRLAGLASGEDLLVQVRYLGKLVQEEAVRWQGDACLVTTVTAAELASGELDEGTYELHVFVGPTLSPLLTSTVELVLTDI